MSRALVRFFSTFFFPVLAAVVVLVVRPREAWADELHAQTDTNVVEVGQTVTLRLEGNTTSGDVGAVEPGPIPGFRVMGRSVMPTRMVSIVNGVRSDRTGVSATFTLVAERVGAFTLGPASAVFGARTVRSGRVDVRVVPKGQGPRRQAPQDPFGGLFGPGGGHTNPFELLSEPTQEPTVDPKLALPRARAPIAFLHATADKTHALVGEQVTYSVYLYVEANGREPQIGDVHEASAALFLKKTLLENDNEAKHVGIAKVGEQFYEVKLVRRAALFPLKSGTLPIGAMSMRVFRNASQRERPESLRETEPLEVTVVEPPAAGRPAGISPGDVGDFTLRAEVAPREASRGGAIAVTLTLEGRGNYPNKLALPTVRGVEWLEPEVHEKLGADTEDRFGGFRSFRYVVRTHEAGTFSLGTVAFPFYSARAKKYDIARVDLGFVTITNDGKAPTPADPLDEAVPNLPAVRGALEGASRVAEKPLSDRREAWLLVFASPFVFVLGTLGTRAKERLADLRRGRQASPEAELAKRLADAKARLEKKDHAGAVRAALTVLEQGALAKLGVSLRGANQTEKRDKLEAIGLGTAAVEDWLAAFASGEARRYSPVPPTESEAKDEVARAAKLVASVKPSALAARVEET